MQKQICRLNEEARKEREENLLNKLAVSTDELIQALEELREDEMKMEAYQSGALYHQKHSEELQSTQFKVCSTTETLFYKKFYFCYTYIATQHRCQ